MTDKEIYQQIEEYSGEADALYERIHERVESSIVNHAQAKKRRKKLFVGIVPAIAVVLVVVLAITLPIVLQPQEQEIRYSDDEFLSREILDCNLNEYYTKNKLSLLYLNFYEDAEDLITARYYDENKENGTVYLHETFTDGNTGYEIHLSVMKRNIVVESLDMQFEQVQTTNIGNTYITYALSRTRCLAKFEYKGYKYYLKINDEVSFDFLVKTIESMFNN